LMLSLAAEPSSCAITCYVVARELHTLSNCTSLLSFVWEELPYRSTLHSLGSPRGSP